MSNNAVVNMDRAYQNFCGQFHDVVSNVLQHRYIREACLLTGQQYHKSLHVKSADLHKRFDMPSFHAHVQRFTKFVNDVWMSVGDAKKFVTGIIGALDMMKLGSTWKVKDPEARLLGLLETDMNGADPDKQEYLEGTSHGAFLHNIFNGECVKALATIISEQFAADVRSDPVYFDKTEADFCSSQNFFSPHHQDIMSGPDSGEGSLALQGDILAQAKSLSRTKKKIHHENLAAFFYADDIGKMTTSQTTFQNRQENSIKALEQFFAANFDYQIAINKPVESLIFHDVNYHQIVGIIKEPESEEAGIKRPVVSDEPVEPSQSVQILSDETPVAVEKAPAVRARKKPNLPKDRGMMDGILFVFVGVLAVLFLNRRVPFT